ncbi:MAG: hypothetical protein ABJF04_16040 [Reichenbachiella sp.]|uniref:hypothetical protein n=1 Tax=Reichenbachiella sp. TaxID=2184521 RepID=UPI003264EA74
MFKEKLFDDINSCFEKNYISVIEQQVDDEIIKMLQIVRKVEDFCTHISSDKTNDAQISIHKSQLHALINEIWDSPKEKKFSELYAEFFTSFQSIFDQLEIDKIEKQSTARFQSTQEDTPWIKFVKFIKTLSFHICKWPHNILNFLQRKKRTAYHWNHTVPLRNLAIRHFTIEMSLDLRSVTDLFFGELNAQYLKIKDWEEAWTYYRETEIKAEGENLSKQIKDFGKALNLEIKESVKSIKMARIEAFRSDYEKAGTIELPGRLFSNTATIRRENVAEKKWSQNNLDWKNAIYALFEEWRSDLDIYTLKHETLAELSEFQSAQIRKLTEYIDPEIEEISQFINEGINSLSVEPESLLKELKRINYLANKKLNIELVPKLCDKLSSQSIVNLISKLEASIRQSVEKLSDEHVIVKANHYDRPIETNELAKISPYELIAFETLAELQDELSIIKMEMFASLEKASVGSTDIDHVVTFSLSSAISAIVEEGKSSEEAVSIANEGLTRALNRLAENRQALNVSTQKCSEQLELVVGKFCKNIMELTVNENVGELRLRIAKAKATKQAEEVRRQLRENLIAKRRWGLSAFKKVYDSVEAALIKMSEKFILTASKPVLTKQVSDFLMESQKAIDKLPMIYRRLYKIEPLTDLELFEGRKEEYDALMSAFESWNQGKFAATAILGEKWGGLTSFINYVMQEAKFPNTIIRFSAKENISDEKKFIEFLKATFQNDTFENLDEFVDCLHDGSKKIIVLENLQNLYLRKVGGFAALQLLFQLITRTNKSVFWVTTTTAYTWSYLSKTINIGDFFSYSIVLDALTSEQIVNLIWKRNKISGFNIRFELTEKHWRDKKFCALEDVDQQSQLKTEFFSELNKFAKSNVSLALIFWLLSTQDLDENTITIGSFKKPDLNFMTTLSMDKVYVLHALILHDGLSELQLSEVLNISESQSRLISLSLLEDGILFKKEEVYVVNPMIYRNTISLLISKNLIH